jgi:hypothetical protein
LYAAASSPDVRRRFASPPTSNSIGGYAPGSGFALAIQGGTERESHLLGVEGELERSRNVNCPSPKAEGLSAAKAEEGLVVVKLMVNKKRTKKATRLMFMVVHPW